MNKRYYIFVPIYFLFFLLLPACNLTDSDSTLTYKPGPPEKISDYKKGKTLFVSNIIDERTGDAKLPSEPNTNPYLFIPFWFYTHTDVNPVLRYSFFQAPLPEAFKWLILSDIKASKIFKKVIVPAYNSDDYMSTQDELNAYRLTIILKEAVWSRNLTSYGLSYPGTFLWVLGFPVSYGNVYITLDLEFYAPVTRRLICRKTIRKSIPCTEWIYDQIYYNPPISEYKLTEIFPFLTKKIRSFLIKGLTKYRGFKSEKINEFIN